MEELRNVNDRLSGILSRLSGSSLFLTSFVAWDKVFDKKEWFFYMKFWLRYAVSWNWKAVGSQLNAAIESFISKQIVMFHFSLFAFIRPLGFSVTLN